jgi:dTDP-4-dehydrorhamnose 3,5-epimerase
VEIEPLAVPGCFLIRPDLASDSRGCFVKTVHSTTMEAKGLNCNFREQYFSRSHHDVVRGLHFQVPPHDHDKLVYCVAGKALDVVVDLRKGSPRFGKACAVVLNGGESTGVWLPRGCAHGFLSLEDDTMLFYHVTSEYAPESDCGILWNSIPFDWPVRNPTVSGRDCSFPPLPTFESPFVFKG